jgi:hypothetical protein
VFVYHRDAAAKESEAPEVIVTAAAAGGAGGAREVLQVPAARVLLLVTLFFCLSFTWMQFLGAWLVQHLTGSSWLVQVTGFMQMIPMVFVRTDTRERTSAVILFFFTGSASDRRVRLKGSSPRRARRPQRQNQDGEDCPGALDGANE